MHNLKSTIDGREVKAAIYLAEIMCFRLAKKNKQKLLTGFWNLPEWKLPFGEQMVAANRLLKVYPEQAVINAVNRKDLLWMYSLRFPRLPQFIKEEVAKLEKLHKKLDAPVVEPQTVTPQNTNEGTKVLGTKNNLLSKLD